MHILQIERELRILSVSTLLLFFWKIHQWDWHYTRGSLVLHGFQLKDYQLILQFPYALWSFIGALWSYWISLHWVARKTTAKKCQCGFICHNNFISWYVNVMWTDCSVSPLVLQSAQICSESPVASKLVPSYSNFSVKHWSNDVLFNMYKLSLCTSLSLDFTQGSKMVQQKKLISICTLRTCKFV